MFSILKIRVDPVGGRTGEPVLRAREQESCVTGREVAWMRERGSSIIPLLATCGKWEGWPQGHEQESLSCTPLTAVPRRAVPVPHLGETVELNLVVWVQVSQSEV